MTLYRRDGEFWRDWPRKRKRAKSGRKSGSISISGTDASLKTAGFPMRS